MVALQAVMAEQLDGDTLHHACGIDPFAREQGNDGKQATRQAEVAKKVLQWRWLIIDEISMVNAKLLAEVDMKLRSIVRRIGTMKSTETGVDRAFGGINVLFAGDFWQLDPPSGTFLGSIPVDFMKRSRRFEANASTAHGQSIFWGRGEGAVQGLTELTECMRCDDAWLREVQDEIRNGQLSMNNYYFLHGMPTTVPGSWCNGRAECKNPRCQELGDNVGKSGRKRELLERQIQEQETKCSKCREERKSKCRVASTPADKRFQEERFATAIAVFPNNDVKYDANKQRARLHAQRSRKPITWVQAKDDPSAQTLQDRPNINAEKKNGCHITTRTAERCMACCQ